MPSYAKFLVALCETNEHEMMRLTVACYPDSKKFEANKLLLGIKVTFQGEGVSFERVHPEAIIVVSLKNFSIPSPGTNITLRFLEDCVYSDSSMLVCVGEKAPQVEFKLQQSDQSLRTLCKVILCPINQETNDMLMAMAMTRWDLRPEFNETTCVELPSESDEEDREDIESRPSQEMSRKRLRAGNSPRVIMVRKKQRVSTTRDDDDNDGGKKDEDKENNSGFESEIQCDSQDEKDSPQPPRKQRQVKGGTPTPDDLEHLGSDLGSDVWRALGARLGIKKPTLDEIDDLHRSLSSKGYNMLLRWKEKNGSAATYQILSQALNHELVNKLSLAETYCYEKQ